MSKKWVNQRTLVSGLLGAALVLVAQVANAGSIVGSKHDFSGTPAYGTASQICVACHAPHNNQVAIPLWNHAPTAATYTNYASPTLEVGVTSTVGAASRLCLSCHDGTIAINNFGGATGAAVLLTGTTLLGTDLSNDHPIGFAYATSFGTDGALFAATNAVTIGTGGTKTRVGTIASNLLYSGQVECSSCHDVHNTFTVPTASSGTGGVSNKLVKVTMNGSALCIACHDK